MNRIESTSGAPTEARNTSRHAPRSRFFAFAALCCATMLAAAGCRLMQSGAEVTPTVIEAPLATQRLFFWTGDVCGSRVAGPLPRHAQMEDQS